jgi:hypothetical protein
VITKQTYGVSGSPPNEDGHEYSCARPFEGHAALGGYTEVEHDACRATATGATARRWGWVPDGAEQALSTPGTAGLERSRAR